MIAIGGGALSDDDSTKSFSTADKGGFGLAIDSELLRGTSSSCATFQSPPLSRANPDGSPFEIVNLEVWTMTPCGDVGNAEAMEMRKLFLESYSAEN